MRITALRQTSAEHVTAVLENGEELKTTLGVVTMLRLFGGRELDEEEFAALQRESARALTREKALGILAQRQMSAKELARRLRDKGADEDTAAWCVAWALEHGLIDEQSYAAAIGRHYAARGYGGGRIRQELQRRGIPRELWEEAEAAVPEGTGEEKLERFIAARLRNPADRDAVRRVSASLYRRGYSGEEIRAALARFSVEAEED